MDYPKSTKHLKERNKSKEDLGNMRSPRDEKTNLKAMLYGPSADWSRAMAKRDEMAGRVTTKAKTPAKKDSSRLGPFTTDMDKPVEPFFGKKKEGDYQRLKKKFGLE